MIGSILGKGEMVPAFLCDARFPLGPSALAFALNSCGSILNTTGPALRGLAGQKQQDRVDQQGARLRPGTEWVVN
jgi:hypothetical protein